LYIVNFAQESPLPRRSFSEGGRPRSNSLRKQRINPPAGGLFSLRLSRTACLAILRMSPPTSIYFRSPFPDYYRRRWSVLRLCSEWEEVVPLRSRDRRAPAQNFYFQNYSSQSRQGGVCSL